MKMKKMTKSMKLVVNSPSSQHRFICLINRSLSLAFLFRTILFKNQNAKNMEISVCKYILLCMSFFAVEYIFWGWFCIYRDREDHSYPSRLRQWIWHNQFYGKCHALKESLCFYFNFFEKLHKMFNMIFVSF